MLDNKGFDLWADGYDKSVGLSDEENTYPFAGYRMCWEPSIRPLWRKRTLLSWTLASAPERSQRSFTKMDARSTARTFQRG